MRKILVVEDEDAIREVVALNLRLAGYEVTEAASAEQALAVFSPSAGGALCPACGPAAADRRWLSAPALDALRALTALAEGDTPVSPRLADGVRGELRPVLGQTVSFVLGRRPRLLGYLDVG